jgi:hypothetical protein
VLIVWCRHKTNRTAPAPLPARSGPTISARTHTRKEGGNALYSFHTHSPLLHRSFSDPHPASESVLRSRSNPTSVGGMLYETGDAAAAVVHISMVMATGNMPPTELGIPNPNLLIFGMSEFPFFVVAVFFLSRVPHSIFNTFRQPNKLGERTHPYH